ncbi:MAG: AlbA family DNA-binding domain-containing protein [Haloechinothrix sp.]
MAVLVAGGEGPRVEFKQEVPTRTESKKNVLKTIAAFASGDGGTVVFGVDDNAQVVGVDPAALDQYQVAVSHMIRNSIEPEPPHSLRVEQVDGKTVLLVEVTAGGRWFALNPDKPEFHLRRGASTMPARLGEIAAGFSPPTALARTW